MGEEPAFAIQAAGEADEGTVRADDAVARHDDADRVVTDGLPDALRQDLEGEVADAFAMILVFARSAGIDIESALTTKWLPWEKFHADRAAGLAPEPLAHRWPEPSDDDSQASS